METIAAERFDAGLFDLDGVLTATAEIHARCWKSMFDAYLRARADRLGEPFREFTVEDDYRPYVDGKPRLDGVRDFLASRGITLPPGNPDDPPDAETVAGLGNRKNELVQAEIRAGHVRVFDDAVVLVRRLLAAGLKAAVVTSSRNCEPVLRAAGIADLFQDRVDGEVAARYGLPGKPAPDTFLKGAELLGVPASRAIVFEDATAGVAAGRAGGFGLVVGVDRVGGRHPEALRSSGADLVSSDLSLLMPDTSAPPR